MREDMASATYPQWAPRDCLQSPSSSYLEFQQKGFDSYEVALSLVGNDATVQQNPFARKNYSFLHMPFAKLAGFLTRLHPEDRFLAFVLTEDAAPVHLYFDLDGAFLKFPQMLNREEEHLSEFMAALACFFERCFGRTMDLSGLLLLQASSAVKMSWHIHISSEAFCRMQQLKLFVQKFQMYLEEVHAAMHDEAEAEASDTADPSPAPLHLCCLDLTAPSTSSSSQRRRLGVASYHHIVDAAPYSSTQNLRAPYNQKPGKTPLRVRHHAWDGNGRLLFTPAADTPRLAADPVIDPNVLFKAHPTLAQPTKVGYAYLSMNVDESAAKRKQSLKRKVDTDASSGRADATNSAAAARSSAVIEHLTDAEVLALKQLLTAELGPHVDFDGVSRELDVETQTWAIKGTTRAGTAYCPHRSSIVRSPYTHQSNRLRFRISEGTQSFWCWSNGCRPVHVPWQLDDLARQLLHPPFRDSHAAGPTSLLTCAAADPLVPTSGPFASGVSAKSDALMSIGPYVAGVASRHVSSAASGQVAPPLFAAASADHPDAHRTQSGSSLSVAQAQPRWDSVFVPSLDSGDYVDEGLRLIRAGLDSLRVAAERAAELEHWNRQRQLADAAAAEFRRFAYGDEDEHKASHARRAICDAPASPHLEASGHGGWSGMSDIPDDSAGVDELAMGVDADLLASEVGVGSGQLPHAAQLLDAAKEAGQSCPTLLQ